MCKTAHILTYNSIKYEQVIPEAPRCMHNSQQTHRQLMYMYWRWLLFTCLSSPARPISVLWTKTKRRDPRGWNKSGRNKLCFTGFLCLFFLLFFSFWGRGWGWYSLNMQYMIKSCFKHGHISTASFLERGHYHRMWPLKVRVGIQLGDFRNLISSAK